MADEHQPGRRAVFIELADKRFQHFGIGQRSVGTRPIGIIAPVLKGPEKEHLHAELPALVVNGENIGFLYRFRRGIALRLHERQGRQAIAEEGGTFEIKLFGRLVHVGLKVIAHGAGLARQKLAGIFHQLAIGFERHLARAWAGAALDLVLQTGPRSGGIEAVRAVAQQKGFLQRGDGAAYRCRRGERAKIVPLPAAGATMLGEFGRLVICGDQDIGKALVVPQQDVEARLEPLDHVGFEQQRFGLGLGAHEFHADGRRDHALEPHFETIGTSIVGDARLEVAGLAHIHHLALGIEHAINARRCGQGAHEASDNIGTARRRRRNVGHERGVGARRAGNSRCWPPSRASIWPVRAGV